MISPAAGLVVPMAHEGRTRPCTARLAFGGAMKFLFDLGYSCPRHTSSCEYGANSLIIQIGHNVCFHGPTLLTWEA